MGNKKLFVGVLLVAVVVSLAAGYGARGVVSRARQLASLPEFWKDLREFLKLRPEVRVSPNNSTITPTAPIVPYEPANSYEESIIKAVDKASPAVVSIAISKDVPIIEQCGFNPFGDLPPEFQKFFGPFGGFSRPCQKGSRHQQVGGGSGFIVSTDGYIATNKHVVADEDAEYTVFTNDGKKYDAKVLARNPMQDIAILKIVATGLPTVAFSDSDRVRLGQAVIAIGNALSEFRNTVSVGIVSGLARNVTAGDGRGFSEQIDGVIQTDAAINPGNSGGPLLNSRGEVIGMNTAIVSGAQNIGFAIPANRIKRDVESVRANGKISVPYLGVRYVMITKEIMERDKLSVENGALIRGTDEGPAVLRDSPAAKAGIRAEDVVTAIDGVVVDNSHPLSSLISQHKVGDRITLNFLRDGKSLELSVVLEERK